MKYKVGDRVRVQSLDWYNENKNKSGNVPMGQFSFNFCNKHLCGTILTIRRVLGDYYLVKENDAYWTDEMIEGLVEEETKPLTYEETVEIIEAMQGIGDSWECPQGYQFVDENGNVINARKIVLEKKKKEYPKTYEECCEILYIIDNKPPWHGYRSVQLKIFQKLLICRDAYWKVAGEEMGLGKPWEPDWNTSEPKFVIAYTSNGIEKQWETTYRKVFVFPTEKMRDAFNENFKELIGPVKELL